MKISKISALVLSAIVETQACINGWGNQDQTLLEMTQVEELENVYQNLCREKQPDSILQEATLLAQQGSQSKAFFVRVKSIVVFIKLLDYNYVAAYEPSLNAAVKAVADKSSTTRSNGLSLIKGLVSRSYAAAYEPAFKAAQDAINSDDYSIYQDGLYLLEALVLQGYNCNVVCGLIFKEAQSATVNINDFLSFSRGLDLFSTIVCQGYKAAYEPAFKAAQVAVTQEGLSLPAGGASLLRSLVSQGYKQANTFVQGAVNNKAAWVRNYYGIAAVEELKKQGISF